MLKGISELKDIRVHRVSRDLRVFKETRALKGISEPKDIRVLRVLQEVQPTQVPQVVWE